MTDPGREHRGSAARIHGRKGSCLSRVATVLAGRAAVRSAVRQLWQHRFPRRSRRRGRAWALVRIHSPSRCQRRWCFHDDGRPARMAASTRDLPKYCRADGARVFQAVYKQPEPLQGGVAPRTRFGSRPNSVCRDHSEHRKVPCRVSSDSEECDGSPDDRLKGA
jgi:hypothetical protein